MDADLSAVLPGRYRWCWRAQGPYSEGFEVAVAVLPPRVTVQPATVLQSMRAEFRFEGWRGAGPVLSAQLVANTTDCAALPPAHVTGNPTVYVARDLPAGPPPRTLNLNLATTLWLYGSDQHAHWMGMQGRGQAVGGGLDDDGLDGPDRYPRRRVPFLPPRLHR